MKNNNNNIEHNDNTYNTEKYFIVKTSIALNYQ